MNVCTFVYTIVYHVLLKHLIDITVRSIYYFFSLQRIAMDSQIDCRRGPTIADYLADFFEYLYHRMGCRLENFQTPEYMKCLLEELSFNRVPSAVWQILLSSALKIAEMRKTVEEKLHHFGAFFADVLCWLCKRLMKMGVLKAGIFLLGAEINPLVTFIVYLIYFCVEYFLERFWSEFSKFVQSYLIDVPYYSRFVSM